MNESPMPGSAQPAAGDALARAEAALSEYFGHAAFRPNQQALIEQVLTGRDVLGVMPTGAGKSLVYQIPALVRGGVTIVISPLISLMKDQVNALAQAGVPAAFVNSSLDFAEQERALSFAASGECRLLYVAPERLDTSRFRAFAERAPITLVAVDEAHCVSQWGQDFRPSYLSIAGFIERLPARPPVCALTATATPAVQADIASALGLRDPFVLVSGFDRENLYFGVERPEPRDKDACLLRLVRERAGQSGIVYCSTRAAVEEVCALLREEGVAATRYHAGLSAEERHRNQDDFLYDRAGVMVATNAFGMGIDKSNVGFVIHYNMPRDLESYYQEAGRAGRDGSPADCILIYNKRDVQTCQFLIDKSFEEREAQGVAASADDPWGEWDSQEPWGSWSEWDEGRSMLASEPDGAVLTCGAEANWPLASVDGRARADAAASGGGHEQQVARIAAERRAAKEASQAIYERDCERLRQMVFYCTTTDCLRAFILRYFGERDAPFRCEHCSNCATDFEMEDATVEAQKILSCVFRLEQRGRRVGRALIVDILRGSKAEKIKQQRLDALSTYGIMADVPAKRVRFLLDAAVAEGLLAATDGQYPVIVPTEEGARFLKERRTFEVKVPKRLPKAEVAGAAAHGAGARNSKSGAKAAAAALAAERAELFERLKALRFSLATEEGVPAYIVFSNATLADMCAKLPADEAAFLEVSGVGRVKAEKYAEPFLAEVKAWVEENR